MTRKNLALLAACMMVQGSAAALPVSHKTAQKRRKLLVADQSTRVAVETAPAAIWRDAGDIERLKLAQEKRDRRNAKRKEKT